MIETKYRRYFNVCESLWCNSKYAMLDDIPVSYSNELIEFAKSWYRWRTGKDVPDEGITYRTFFEHVKVLGKPLEEKDEVLYSAEFRGFTQAYFRMIGYIDWRKLVWEDRDQILTRIVSTAQNYNYEGQLQAIITDVIVSYLQEKNLYKINMKFDNDMYSLLGLNRPGRL